METVPILGIDVLRAPAPEVIGIVLDKLAKQQDFVIGSCNTNYVWHYYYCPGFADRCRTIDLVLLDSVPLVYWARLLRRRIALRNRVTAIDYLPLLLGLCQNRSHRVFFLGGTPKNQIAVRRWVAKRYPNLHFASHHGYFDKRSDSEENLAVVQTIKSCNPDLLLVGMGMPLQESWMATNRTFGCVCILIGATFDYFTGLIPTPNRTLGYFGFEWFARLVAEPRRLWKRYLFQPLALLPYLLRDARGSLPSGCSQRSVRESKISVRI